MVFFGALGVVWFLWGALVCLELLSMWTVVRVWARAVRQLDLRDSIPAPRSGLRPSDCAVSPLRPPPPSWVDASPLRQDNVTSGLWQPNQHQLSHALGVIASPRYGSSPHDARFQTRAIQLTLSGHLARPSGGLHVSVLVASSGSVFSPTRGRIPLQISARAREKRPSWDPREAPEETTSRPVPHRRIRS
jgi:hypothetical protein